VPSDRKERAVSPQIGVILLVAITLVLAILVLLLFHLPSFDFLKQKEPSFLEIRSVFHQDEHGYLNYDSRVILFHSGTETLNNSQLWAEFYRNGTKLPVNIITMNGNEFISTPHYGVQTMGGLGCSGSTWTPGEKIALDFSDGTFHPGDTIRADIFMRPSGILVSRYSSVA
jgi:flagellin-like protein